MTRNFSYEEFWEMREPVQKPQEKRAEELGLYDDVPVSPALTRLTDTKRRIANMFCAYDLEEAGIDVKAMLTYMTEQEVMEELEAGGVEQAIEFSEVEALVVSKE